MDMPVHMQAIMAKLPFRMREQWRTVAQDIMGNTHETAHFWDLVAFIECLYCRHGHSLEDCQQFKERTHKDKLQVLRERGACFACLCVGHKPFL